MSNIRQISIALILASATFMAGCASSPPPTPNEPTPQHATLMNILADYQLPSASIRPTPNPDADVDQAIYRMESVAKEQGLIFDGSRAAQGIVVIGHAGTQAPILLGLSVYKKNGRVAFQDTSNANGLDYSDGMKMRERFLNAF